MVLVSNDVYRLESMSGFGTRARIDDGVLGVVTVAVDRARDLPALISAEATGRIRRFSGYRGPRPSSSWLGQPPVDVSVDGEALQLAPPLRFRSLPGAFRPHLTRCARRVPGRPTPGRAVGTAKALVRVVGGRPGQ
jgi:diacylglycerol kinase family enzyme